LVSFCENACCTDWSSLCCIGIFGASDSTVNFRKDKVNLKDRNLRGRNRVFNFVNIKRHYPASHFRLWKIGLVCFAKYDVDFVTQSLMGFVVFPCFVDT